MGLTSECQPAGDRHASQNDEKHFGDEQVERLPNTQPNAANAAHIDDDEEPEFHARTWIALIALFFLNYVQVFALTGPADVVSAIAVSEPSE